MQGLGLSDVSYSADTDPRHPHQPVRIVTNAATEAECMRAVREHLALHPDVMRVHIAQDCGRSHCGWKLTRREIVAAGTLPALQFEGLKCFISHERSDDRVTIRFGTPRAWQGEIIVDRSSLRFAPRP